MPEPTCTLHDTIGDTEVKRAEAACTRRIHATAGGTRGDRCAGWHGIVEDLIERKVLVTAADMMRHVAGSTSLAKADAQAARDRIEQVRALGAQDRARLDAVRALVDVRRKTVRMEDLRRALGDPDESAPPAGDL